MLDTNQWQRLEGVLCLIAGIVIFISAESSLVWWLALLIFFVPDVSFAAYLGGPKAGAAVYNFMHVYALGAVLMAIGFWLAEPVAVGVGALWFGHTGFDRMLGYGLKSSRGFTFTHMGEIGSNNRP